ncbi:hypothetical protein AVEN_267082-1 [Araneus ventricosus]|uniref:Uncharacterized protein n=1 Tax=Araneus ventricosus TaxID=182803 RepID=A0A4Y2UNS5_ARAVE|nr:hypothetical protein AVEN_267082-1 [Araneus ventricosus]
MVWAGISLGYRTDLHIYRRGSVLAVRYRDEVLDPIVKLYAAVAGPSFVLMDDKHVPIQLPSLTTFWRVKGLRVWSGRLYVNVSHLQPLSEI